MKDLSLGDLVLVGPNKYEPIYSFAHYHNTTEALFLRLHTNKGGRPLEITPDHMIQMDGGRFVPASSLKVGDRVQFVGVGGEMATASVTQVRQTKSLGAYAPFTPSGTIVVDGVVASNYIAIQENSMDIPTVFGKLALPVTFQWLAHASQAPHRMWCISLNLCHQETYNEDGMSKWLAGPARLLEWEKDLGEPFQAIVLVLAVVVFFVFFVVEMVVCDVIQYQLLAAWCLVAALFLFHLLGNRSRRADCCR